MTKPPQSHSGFPGDEWTGDRRAPTQFDIWRQHVDVRLDKQDEKQKSQDEKLDQILDLLRASKLGLAALRWLVAFGAGVAAILVAFDKFPHK